MQRVKQAEKDLLHIHEHMKFLQRNSIIVFDHIYFLESILEGNVCTDFNGGKLERDHSEQRK